MTDNTMFPDAQEKSSEELENLYKQHFTPLAEEVELAGAFTQVSMLDNSLATYTSDSTTTKDYCA